MRNLLVVIGAIFALFSCNTKQYYSDSFSFDETEWNKDSIVTFSVDVTDTTQLYDAVFSVTNTDEYQYANLYLFTDIVMPNQQVIRDTIEFMLSTPDGQWLGTGFSGYTNEFQLRSNIRFPIVGTYLFSFEQAMRCKNAECYVTGIKSVSLTLNKK